MSSEQQIPRCLYRPTCMVVSHVLKSVGINVDRSVAACLEVVSLTVTVCELSKIISWKYTMSEITLYGENCQTGNLYVGPKRGFGHTYKVSAWNSHKNIRITISAIHKGQVRIVRKRWRATAWCGKSKFAISSGWLKNGSLCHPDDIITLS